MWSVVKENAHLVHLKEMTDLGNINTIKGIDINYEPILKK
jgi:hypothetical protein